MYGNYEDDSRFGDDTCPSTWTMHAIGQTPDSENSQYEYCHSRSHAYDEYSTSYDEVYDGLHARSSQYRDDYAYGNHTYDDPYHDHESSASGSREPSRSNSDRYDAWHGHRRLYNPRHSRFDSSTRGRAPTPPPASSPVISSSPPQRTLPLGPSESYLQAVAESSREDPSNAPRKLIILDLNGTLLVRTGRGSRGGRAIHPRPYMPSFRDYVFSPRTRAWLDTMIWSSAQPHNVDRMVHRCFFDASLGSPTLGARDDEEQLKEDDEVGPVKWEGKLLAVWARDTLGLSHAQYGTKTQTTKDLDKPWSSFRDRSHGPLSTLLLDDSPAKARLQPYNHVCIHEYDETRRSQDVQLKRYALRQAVQESHSRRHRNNEYEDEGLGEALSSKVPRREKKELIQHERVLARAQFALPSEAQTSRGTNDRGKFDETLLAVIGILSVLRTETNVAGWIRAGGLWAGYSLPSSPGRELDSIFVSAEKLSAEQVRRAPSPTDAEVEEPDEPLTRVDEVDANIDVGTSADELQQAGRETRNCRKRQRLHETAEGAVQADSHPSPQETPSKRAKFGEDAAEIIEGFEPEMPQSSTPSGDSVAKSPGTQSPREDSATTHLEPSTEPLPTATSLRPSKGAILAGNDSATLGASDSDLTERIRNVVHSTSGADMGPDTVGSGNREVEVYKRPSTVTSRSAQMWYEDERVFEYWVARGREALDELGIEVRDGVVV